MTLVASEAGVGIDISLYRLTAVSNLVFVPFTEKAPGFKVGIVWRRDRESAALRGLVEKLESSMSPLARIMPGSIHFRPGFLASGSKA